MTLKASSIWFPPSDQAIPLMNEKSPSHSSQLSSWQSVDLQHQMRTGSSESLLSEHSQSGSPTLHLWRQWLRARFWRIVAYLVAVQAAYLLITASKPYTYLSLQTINQPAAPLDFPAPPECASSSFNEPGWIFDSSRQSYMIALAHEPTLDQVRANPQKYLQKQVSQTAMSQACADQWIARSEVCEMIRQGISELKEEEIDMAWTFVIPTDHWTTWKEYHQSLSPGDSGVKRDRFRYYDQLRYSIRSVFKYAPFMRQGHMVAASMPASRPEGVNTSCNVVQVPPWLNMGAIQADDAKLKLVSHHSLFAPTAEQSDLQAWHAISLPNFNSLAIESQLHRLPASTLLYFNDDFYLGRRLAPSDIASLLLGPTFRITFTLSWVKAVSDEELQNFRDRGKHGRYTTKFLEQRFGTRKRHWPDHFAYTMNIPVSQELAYIWPEEIQETSETRFRDHGREVCATLFATHYMIEKHREALLWSFLVAASDKDQSGTYSAEERAHMRNVIGGHLKQGRIHVTEPLRPGTDADQRYYDQQLENAHIEKPRETLYQWSSQDGYPFLGPIHQLPYQLRGDHPSFCKISVSKCFGRSDFFSATEADADATYTPEELFRNIAFRNTACGDCLIVALLGASGPHGLSAFLPEVAEGSTRSAHRMSRRGAVDEVPLVGGLSRDWESADFSLASALRNQWSPRDFSARLIQRYSYTIGRSPKRFAPLRNNEDSYKKLKAVLDSPPAFIAINDGMGDLQTGVQKLNDTFQVWQKRLFSKKLPYES